MSTPLIALDDLKAFLPIRQGNDQFDPKLWALINTVSRQVEMACRRAFGRKSYSEIFSVTAGAKTTYDLYGGSTDGLITCPTGHPFYLNEAPLVQGETVAVYFDTSHRFTGDTQLAQDDIVVLPEKGAVFVNVALPQSRDSLKIAYDAGYDAAGSPPTLTAALPEDLKFAVITQCVYLWERSMGDGIGSDEDSSGNRYVVSGGLLPDVVSLLSPYRKQLRGFG